MSSQSRAILTPPNESLTARKCATGNSRYLCGTCIDRGIEEVHRLFHRSFSLSFGATKAANPSSRIGGFFECALVVDQRVNRKGLHYRGFLDIAPVTILAGSRGAV